MPPRKHVREQNRKRAARLALIALVIVLAVGLVVGAVFLIFNNLPSSSGGGKTEKPWEPSAPAVVSTATLGSSGDILIHNPVRVAGWDSANKTFDFSPSFAHLQPYVTALDYAIVNAEFSVSANGSYSSLPFRVPTAVVKALKDCGYDLGLTANNHISDGGVAGIKKTMSTLAEYGMDYTGSRQSNDEKRYLLKEVNGIKFGIVNYTYNACWNTNSFSTGNLSKFYGEMESMIGEMRGEGADIIYLYIHWGEEYSLSPNEHQQNIAQKMCELGVDVIVGGHPHKIQPLELIQSADGSRQTLCLYSSGNLLSGQQIECMAGGTYANSPYCFQDSWHHAGCDYPDVSDRTKDTHRLEHGKNCNDNGHTEDGLLFNVTATKYEDGTVMITGVDVLPVWCMGRGFVRAGYPTNSSFKEYILIPLDKSVDWKTKFGLTDAEATEAGYSYDRTMALVKPGMEAINAACKAKYDAYDTAFKATQTKPTEAE